MFRFSAIPLELAIMTASEYLPETEPRPLPRDRYEKASFATSEIEISGATVDEVYDDRYLVVSPYTEKDHLLDLETLDTENQLLALSLTSLTCLRDDYATAPYVDIFNWGDVIEGLRALARQRNHVWREASFFVVAFRSQIPPTTAYADLGALDKAAHIEATSSGGFLKYVDRVTSVRWQHRAHARNRYWFGSPDSEGRNLATCIWRSQEDAKRGGAGPAHRKAAGSARSLYSFWQIERHRLTIRDGIGGWEISRWSD